MFGSKISTDEQKIEKLLTRRIEAVFPSREEAEKRFKGGKRLRVYLGIDPTGPNLHLGHIIPLLFLKQLLELGHKPIVLIGDFTARVGDPTGKEVARRQLTEKEVRNNMKNYLGQIYKILPKGSFEVKYNSSWLSKMSSEEVFRLASHVTVNQMLSRDLFEKIVWKWKCPNCNKISRSPIQFKTRENFETTNLQHNTRECPHCKKIVPFEKEDIFLENESEFRTIGLQEYLYPLMQGYDSVAMKVDGEVGGNDQTFNMLVGRDLEKKLLNKDKLVFATRLLVDAESGKKMSKTEGGLISLSDSPQDMFGKTMKTVPDEMTELVFWLCTEKPSEWIEEKAKGDPYEFKKELASELVRMYHGEKKAMDAWQEWSMVFSKGELPSEMEEVEGGRLVDVVEVSGGVSSTQSKRLIDQGAVSINKKTVKEWGRPVGGGDVVQIGPKKFVKIK